MKRICTIFMLMIVLFGLVGCSDNYNANPNKSSVSEVVQDKAKETEKQKNSYPSNIPAPHNITRRAVNHLKQNYNVQEVIQQDDAKFVGSNENGYHFISMIKVRLNTGVKVARVNVHFSPDGKTYTCESKLRNPNADGT